MSVHGLTLSATLPLKTDRLLLRNYRADDFAATHAFATDPEVVRYMEWGPNDETETHNFIRTTLDQQAAEPRTHFTLAILLREHEPSELIGNCSLRIDPGSRQAELGYTYDRRHWGHGYATEAAAAILHFGFRWLDLHRIYAKCVAENLPSARIMEKLGMRREGHFRAYRQVHGTWRDFLYYAILDREWAEKHPPDNGGIHDRQ